MSDCFRQPVPQIAVMSIRTLEPNDASGPPERKCGATYPQLYRQAGAVPRLHLLLLEDPPVFAVGSRHAAIFPRVAVSGPSDGPESGEAEIHRENAGSGPLGQAAGAPRSAAGFDVRA